MHRGTATSHRPGFDVRTEGSTIVVSASGSLDFYSAERLLRLLDRVLSRPACREVRVDLGDVAFLSFEGLAALLGAYEIGRGIGKTVRVTGATGQPADILELSGLRTLLSVDERQH
jgi:anti-anti-sigma factor